jgi:hypothetical protein
MAKKTNQVKLTPEIRKKLMGISVVSDTIDYVYEIDGLDPEFHPTFTLKSFTVEDSRKFKEISKNKVATGEDGATSSDDVNDLFEETIRTHIRSWRNLYDMSTGEEYEYVNGEDGYCDKDRYYSIPTALRASILTFLIKLTGVM